MSPTNDSRTDFIRAVLADAALAFVAAAVIGLVIASLAAAGIITMRLAYVLLGLAWLVALGGTFLVPWGVAHRHRTIFASLLAIMLAGVGWFEAANYTEPPSAKEIAREIAKLNFPPPAKHEPETTVKVKEKPSQATVDVAPEYLMGLYNGLTAIQADKLAAAYIGKWMPISGAVQNVDGANIFGAALISIALPQKEAPPKLMFLYFDESEVTHIEGLLQGQSIKAFCQINRFGANDLRLIHCERR